MRRSSLVLSLAFLLGCGTEPPGTLTLTVDDLPKFSPTRSITVSGTVTREPSSDTPIIVAVAGGSKTVSDSVDTSFSFLVLLKSNQENQLSITAFDRKGSVADAIVVSVFHDDTAPSIVGSIPLDKLTDVSLTTAIELRYGEPLVQGPTASFTLKQNSRPVPGTATLSGDKTLFTFQPDQPLEPASIYEMVVSGFEDEAGNPAGGGSNACFITTFDPAQTVATQDTSSSIFRSQPPPDVVSPVDMLGATLTRSGPTLYGLFEFASERSLTGQSSRASIFVDIDLDNNPTTGFQSFKDFQFDQSFPELSANLGAEMVVSIDAHVIADSGFVGVNTADVTWDVIDSFLPGVCGRFFGFHTTTIFGDSVQDDGNFAYAYTGFAAQDSSTGSTGVFADPVPVAGSFVADLTNPGPSASRTVPLPTRRVWPPREVVAPLIRLLRLLQGR